MPTAEAFSEPPEESPEIPGNVLADEVALLAAGLASAAQRLLPAMAQMIRPGVPLPEVLLADLGEHRHRFERLRGQIRARAGELGLPCPPADSLSNLVQLEALLAELGEAELHHAAHQRLCRQALEVLDRVRAITHRSESEEAPLRSALDAAARLRAAIGVARARELPAEARALATGEHPLACLLALAAAGSATSDSRWEELRVAVGAAFGRTLAAAAARGKLVAPFPAPELPDASTTQLAEAATTGAASDVPASSGKPVAIPRPVPLRATRPRIVNPEGLKVELY
jgi:hypothetical protein